MLRKALFRAEDRADDDRMGLLLHHRSIVVSSLVVLATLGFLSACSSSRTPTTTSTSTPTSSSVPTTTTLPSSGSSVALGTNNPAQGDCTTNTSETSAAVGSVVLTVTSSVFQADIDLQSGSPNTTYAVLLQQVPGSCPQQAANGGTLTTDSTGQGHSSASVALVAGATTFFVQLVPPGGSGAPQYTSDRITIES